MLDGTVTDATEATALSHNPGHIDIYSASWGPEDDGKTVDGPGVLAKQAFLNGITKGRNGLGSIFVWASGNGGRYGDSCNCDGYTNSIYTLSISSATQAGFMPWYLEQCSSTLATTYSSGTLNKDKSIATADMDTTYFKDLEKGRTPNEMNLCTQSHTGTSASAPIAAAICALALEANRKLTWRDMQYLVLMTSRPEPLSKEDGWVKNAVGRQVSSKFGYGLMDAAAMVRLAKQWTTVPSQHRCETAANTEERIIPKIQGGQLAVNMTTDGCKNQKNAVIYLEHVQVKVTLYFVPRGNLKIILKSPSGTPSTVLLPRPNDVSDGAFSDWPFMSVHFWGEGAEGNWQLTIINDGTNETPDSGELVKWSLVLYGTDTQPVNPKDYKRTENRSPRIAVHGHQNFLDRTTNGRNENVLSLCVGDRFLAGVYRTNCVEKCPVGQYGDLRDYTCHNCDYSCQTCYGPSVYNCLSCSENMFFWNNTCVITCPDGFYGDDDRRECLPCSAVCSKCYRNRDVCMSCKMKMFLHETHCYTSCPDGTFPSNSMCEKCDVSCDTCFGRKKSECLSCEKGYFLHNGACIPSCPEGYFSDSDLNRKCRRCHGSCKSCVNKTSCLPCRKHPEILEPAVSRNLCVYNFPCSSRRSSSDNCEQCSGICRRCSDAADCVMCAEGLVWSPSEVQCVENCPDGTYPHLGECYRCDETCMKCENEPYEKCLSCKYDLVLHNGSCLTVCPEGFYADDKRQCTNCHHSCFKCKGGTSSDCTSCHVGSFLMNNKCYSSCPEGSYAVPHKKVPECVPCYHLCKTCKDFGPLHCTNCYDNSSFIDGTCVPCLDDEYFDTKTKSCRQCHDKCGRCSGPSENNCLSCQAPLRYDEGNHICLQCCGNSEPKGVKCCVCSKNLDVCINSSDHPRSIYGVSFDPENINEIVIPMKHVVPVVIAICMSAVVLYVILFGILQANARGWCSFKSYGRQYERVPNHMGARFDAETEKVLLTQDDLDEEDDIYEKA